MTATVRHDWVSFLRQWSEDMLASHLGKDLPDSVRNLKWLGSDPATDTQITQAENRLKIALPPSYRAFLRISNGWLRTTFAIERIWGTQEIDWFRKKHRDWISCYLAPSSFEAREETPDEEYFTYERAEDFRTRHLRETLQISEVGDSAVLLLNPQVITKDGEWEAWFFANWLPGVWRYRSFLEMMQAEYNSFIEGDWKQPTGLIGDLPNEYVGSPGSAKRHLRKRTKRREPKVLGRRLHDWTVDELVEMLQRTDFPPFREEIAVILGKLGDPRAIEHLIAISNEDTSASVTAIYALRRLAPECLAETLLELVKKRHFCTFHAAAILLAEMGEERAVSPLVDVLRDSRLEARHQAEYVGQTIASFGPSGFDALVKLLKSEQPFIRLRAVTGLICARHPNIRHVLESLLHDSEPRIREMATMRLESLPPKRG
jgi:hypothetical protein